MLTAWRNFCLLSEKQQMCHVCANRSSATSSTCLNYFHEHGRCNSYLYSIMIGFSDNIIRCYRISHITEIPVLLRKLMLYIASDQLSHFNLCLQLTQIALSFRTNWAVVVSHLSRFDDFIVKRGFEQCFCQNTRQAAVWFLHCLFWKPLRS